MSLFKTWESSWGRAKNLGVSYKTNLLFSPMTLWSVQNKLKMIKYALSKKSKTLSRCALRIQAKTTSWENASWVHRLWSRDNSQKLVNCKPRTSTTKQLSKVNLKKLTPQSALLVLSLKSFSKKRNKNSASRGPLTLQKWNYYKMRKRL